MFNTELAKRYSDDIKFMDSKRDSQWLEQNSKAIRESVDFALYVLDLDQPWENICTDPTKEALANMLLSSVTSCLGVCISAQTYHRLNERRYGQEISNYLSSPHFTANHTSVPTRQIPLDSNGQSIGGMAVIHNIPTFVPGPDRRPTLGSVSPVSVVAVEDGGFEIQFETPGRHIWRRRLEVIRAPEYSGVLVGPDDDKIPAGLISMHCSSGFSVSNIQPTCQENCLMCGVQKGSGEFTETRKTQVSDVLDLIIDDAVKKGHAIQQTLSGGALSTGDGGFSQVYQWALSEIKQKVEQAKIRHNTSDIKVQLQVEMLLPPDKSTWQSVIDQLNYYVDLGWDISLAINIEVLADEWEGLFLRGVAKGASSLEDHLEFARMLSEKTNNRVKMNSLVMFGLKPVSMSYSEYMAVDLTLLRKLILAGIHPEYGPVKIETGGQLEGYPAVDPVAYMIQYLTLRKMITDAQQLWSPGCVGGCSACHNLKETNRLLRITNTRGISLPQVFTPILNKLGPEYTREFAEIFA